MELRTKIYLILIIASGLVLNFWHIGFGLPLFLIPDEEVIFGHALIMVVSNNYIPSLAPELFSKLYYPFILPFTSSIVVLISSSIYSVVGHLPRNQLLVLSAVGGTNFLIYVRAISAIAGSLLPAVVFFIANRLYSKKVGFIAAFLVFLSFFHVNLSHWMRHWVILSLLVYTFYYFIIRYGQTGKGKWLTGVIGSVAVGVNYLAGLFILLVVPVVYKYRKKFSFEWKSFAKVNVFLIFILSIILISLHYSDFLFQFFNTDHNSLTQQKSLLDLVKSVWFSILVFVRNEPHIFFPALGSLILMSKHRRESIYIFSSILFYVVLVFVLFKVEIRYLYLFIPALAILAALFIEKVYAKRKYYYLIPVILLVVFQFVSVIRFEYLLSKKDTRLLALEWLEENIDGQEIVLDTDKLWIPRTPESASRELIVGNLRGIDQLSISGDLDFINVKKYNYSNVNSWDLDRFSDKLATREYLRSYIDEVRPEYAIVENFGNESVRVFEGIIEERGELVVKFSQNEDNHEIHDVLNNFYAGNYIFWQMERLGPDVMIYKFDYEE